jgi:hypothetical protein
MHRMNSTHEDCQPFSVLPEDSDLSDLFDPEIWFRSYDSSAGLSANSQTSHCTHIIHINIYKGAYSLGCNN